MSTGGCYGRRSGRDGVDGSLVRSGGRLFASDRTRAGLLRAAPSRSRQAAALAGSALRPLLFQSPISAPVLGSGPWRLSAHSTTLDRSLITEADDLASEFYEIACDDLEPEAMRLLAFDAAESFGEVLDALTARGQEGLSWGGPSPWQTASSSPEDARPRACSESRARAVCPPHRVEGALHPGPTKPSRDRKDAPREPEPGRPGASHHHCL